MRYRFTIWIILHRHWLELALLLVAGVAGIAAAMQALRPEPPSIRYYFPATVSPRDDDRDTTPELPRPARLTPQWA